MENSNKFNLQKLIRSFGYAFTGIYELIKSEQNARIHLFVSVCVVIAGFIFKISATEWCIVALCIGLVFSIEALNTVLEKLVDHLFPQKHETARITKDIAAGAVLIATLMAVVCGLIIFLPKLLALF